MKMTKLDVLHYVRGTPLHNVRKISFVAVLVAEERQISETYKAKVSFLGKILTVSN